MQVLNYGDASMHTLAMSPYLSWVLSIVNVVIICISWHSCMTFYIYIWMWWWGESLQETSRKLFQEATIVQQRRAAPPLLPAALEPDRIEAVTSKQLPILPSLMILLFLSFCCHYWHLLLAPPSPSGLCYIYTSIYHVLGFLFFF